MGAVFDPLLGQLRTTDSGLFVAKSGDTMTGTLNGRSIIPTATATYTLGSTTAYYTNSYITRQNFNSTAYLDGATAGRITLSGGTTNELAVTPTWASGSIATIYLGDTTSYIRNTFGAYTNIVNASLRVTTNSDFWGDRGFKFGAGASTGTDPFSGSISGIKGYVSANLFILQPFADTNNIQEWKNAAGNTMLKVLGANAVLSPSANNGTDLGTSSLYFANSYATRRYFNTTAYIETGGAGQIGVTGSVGIGTTNPLHKLQVVATANNSAGMLVTTPTAWAAGMDVSIFLGFTDHYIRGVYDSADVWASYYGQQFKNFTGNNVMIVGYNAGSNVGIGTTTPSSTLQVAGSVATAYVAKTGAYTLTASDSVVEYTSGTVTATLPTAVGITGRQYTIKNSGAGAITVATTSAQTIDGASTYPLSIQYKYVVVTSNGANWIITGNN